MNKHLKLMTNIANNYKNSLSRVGPVSKKMRILGNRKVGKQLIRGRDLGTYKELNDILKACSYMMP